MIALARIRNDARIFDMNPNNIDYIPKGEIVDVVGEIIHPEEVICVRWNGKNQLVETKDLDIFEILDTEY